MGVLPLVERVLTRRRPVFPLPASSSSVLGSLLAGSPCDASGTPRLCDLPSVGHSQVRRSSGFSHIIRRLPIRGNEESRLCKILFSTMGESILVWAQDPGQVALEIKNAVDERRLDGAWRLYEQHVHMDGFPRQSVLSKLVCGLAESCDRQWLCKASGLAEQLFEEKKHELLGKQALIYLSYVLAKCELAVPASTLLRKLVEVGEFPPAAVWTCVVAHISQTAAGAFLAAELVSEIGYIFKDNRVDPRKKSNKPLLLMRPDPVAFNLALTGCLVFGTTKKAEQLLELMPRVGIRADPDLLIVMAHVFERNGRIDEMKKLRRHIDDACGDLKDSQFQQFYNSLLSCHLKLRELTSACDLVLDMLRRAKKAKSSLAAARSVLEVVQEGRKPSLSMEDDSGAEELVASEELSLIKARPPSFTDFTRDRKFLRLDAEVKALLRHLSDKLQAQAELVKVECGILHPSEKIYAKLVRAFLEAGKIDDLAAFLIKVNNEESPVSRENSVVVQVVDACITMGLLEPAHDLLDELRFHGVRVSSSVYSSLLKAYCREGRMGEITALLKDAQKAGVQLDSSCYESLIQARVHQKNIAGALHLFREMKESSLLRSGQEDFEQLLEGCAGNGKPSLMSRLLMEIREDDRVECGVHDWNNVIHFFCKKRLMQDAHKAMRKMRALGHTPNAQTFHSLVTGYAAIGGKYVEITDLWGEMKALSGSTPVDFDQELLDSLLYCFVRGGFFLRANEVVGMMERESMFIDKYKYRTLWLKYHRTLYKGKAPKIQTEAQCKRREAALTFRAWLGFS
ncbi:unnamed protein product [Spirodela intermedia]|uniref:At1g68980-like TPR repeats domain-containing protein n=1 Tax=Spirodela intermedia TaxID=51605 RepID=A0A7I8L349_SPIIN|nr:unnamed protein product [Spirodela intermedia]